MSRSGDPKHRTNGTDGRPRVAGRRRCLPSGRRDGRVMALQLSTTEQTFIMAADTLLIDLGMHAGPVRSVPCDRIAAHTSLPYHVDNGTVTAFSLWVAS